MSKEYTSTEKEWLCIWKDFKEKWILPHYLGAMDGKHIRIECASLSGSNYYNYKEFYSMVLLAVCDSKYCFILHDTGQFGSNNESGMPNKIWSPLAHPGIPDLIKAID